MGGHPRHDRAHAVLADAVVDEVAAGLLGRLRLGAGHAHPGVAGQVGGARHETRDGPAGGVEAGLRLCGWPSARPPARTPAAPPPSRASRAPAWAAAHRALSPCHASNRTLQAARSAWPFGMHFR